MAEIQRLSFQTTKFNLKSTQFLFWIQSIYEFPLAILCYSWVILLVPFKGLVMSASTKLGSPCWPLHSPC